MTVPCCAVLIGSCISLPVVGFLVINACRISTFHSLFIQPSCSSRFFFLLFPSVCVFVFIMCIVSDFPLGCRSFSSYIFFLSSLQRLWCLLLMNSFLPFLHCHTLSHIRIRIIYLGKCTVVVPNLRWHRHSSTRYTEFGWYHVSNSFYIAWSTCVISPYNLCSVEVGVFFVWMRTGPKEQKHKKNRGKKHQRAYGWRKKTPEIVCACFNT